MTMREAGQVLGISHQRIKQLVDRPPADHSTDLISTLGSALDESHEKQDTQDSNAT